jgi:hypothetical protein
MQANLDAIRAKDKQLKVDAEKLKAAAATEDRMHVSFGAAALLQPLQVLGCGRWQ